LSGVRAEGSAAERRAGATDVPGRKAEDAMTIWKHIFVLGEYPIRESILSGLDAALVSKRLPGANHSIYEELWHLSTWQQVVLSQSQERYEEWVSGARFPDSAGPANQAQWNALVKEFLDGLQAAVALTRPPADLKREIAEGVVLGEVMQALAVHNAYHLGKIVSLRQSLGCWLGEAPGEGG
jgi:hypothetical protein